MTLKLPLQFKQYLSMELSKTSDRHEKLSLLPAINNENHYQTDQFDQRYTHKPLKLSQQKVPALPLTSRDTINHENQASPVQSTKGKSHKKLIRPLAAKPKSIPKKE